jgi:2,3-bisphosphoglycerate-dependent phosphoglycerate mutase
MSTISKKLGKLVIVRHHESEWNKLGLWTGRHEAHLTPYGFQKSEEMGALVKDICFDHAFASMQVRSIETLTSMLNVCAADQHLPVEYVAALNERDYGDYTGKSKWDMEQLLGEEEFTRLRRGWDYPIPHGESLKMVYERVIPFYLDRVLPLLRRGQSVLIVSHGNAIRSLIKYIEQVPDTEVAKIEAVFGGIAIYDVDERGHKIKEEMRYVASTVNA